jgi:hypothetical protein
MGYSITQMKDFGHYFDVAAGVKPQLITTASGAISGNPVDRTNYLSGSIVVSAALAQSKVKTSTLAVKLQHSATTASSTFVDFKFEDGTTVGTVTVHSTATVTPSVVSAFPIRLSGTAKYVRVSLTPTLPTGSTVTLTGPVSANFILGGKHDTP